MMSENAESEIKPSGSDYYPSGRSRPFCDRDRLFPTERAYMPGTNLPIRRLGSNGYESLLLIIRTPGITYGAYIAAGGRATDLRMDYDRMRVRCERAGPDETGKRRRTPSPENVRKGARYQERQSLSAMLRAKSSNHSGT